MANPITSQSCFNPVIELNISSRPMLFFNPQLESTDSESLRKKGVKRKREDVVFERDAKIQKIIFVIWFGQEISNDIVRHVTLFLDFRSLNHFEQSQKSHRALTDLAWRELRLQAGFKARSESQDRDKPEKWNFLFGCRMKKDVGEFLDIFDAYK